MIRKAIFSGLVFDESGRPVETVYIGGEPCYVVDDFGFKRHIPAEQVDNAVLISMKAQIEGNEDFLSEQAAKLMGSEDIFSKAIIENQLNHLDQQFTALSEVGLPEESKAYMGMVGFKVVINIHGEVVHIEQPTSLTDEGDGGDE